MPESRFSVALRFCGKAHQMRNQDDAFAFALTMPATLKTNKNQICITIYLFAL